MLRREGTMNIDPKIWNSLSEKERTICTLFAQGVALENIAAVVGLIPKQVQFYLAGSIAKKFGVVDRKSVEAILHKR